MTFIQQWQSGGKRSAQYLGTDYSPVALYKLDESLSDSSASGLPDLTVTGNEYYADAGLGLKGFYFDSTTSLALSSAESALQITGNVTLQCITSMPFLEFDQNILRCIGPGSNEADNVAYQVFLKANTNLISYFAEYGTKQAISYTSTGGFLPNETAIIGLVRSSNEVTFYVNGRQIGNTSSGLSSPTGATASKLQIGGTLLDGAVICSVKIINSALSAAQMKAEYNLSLGPVLGELT
jgi:hypothetical protein